MVKEPLGHTVYCFSTPIYHMTTRKPVNPSFEKTKNGYYFRGSNGAISVCQNRCVFENRDGSVVISLKDQPSIQGDEDHTQSDVVIAPTLNRHSIISYESAGHFQRTLWTAPLKNVKN